VKKHPWFICALSSALFAGVALGEVKVTVDHNTGDKATPAFKFDNVPSPAKVNAAINAKFRVTMGDQDENGGGADVLHDGKLPTEEDQPTSNFFFSQGSKGGRFVVDLGSEIEIKQINSYSWHADTRAPQVYKVSGSNDLKGEWKQIADVDTRPKSGAVGGQYGVSIADADGTLGKYRYLRFDVSSTENDDQFGNTFYSEIDVIDKNELIGAGVDKAVAAGTSIFHVVDPPCEIVIDTSGAPDLKEWVDTKLGPTLVEWYPKIVKMLPSDGYQPPTRFTVLLRPGSGVAATGGTRITANSGWLKSEINREAVGAIVHEEVHVVQQYGYGRTTFARRRGGATTQPAGAPATPRPRGTGNPTWLVEGIADYVRWWYYEPDGPRRYPARYSIVRAGGRGRRGGAATRPATQVAAAAPTSRPTSYDGSYTISANFLMYVAQKYDKNIVQEMNAAMRELRYDPELWVKYTGKTVEQLGAEWNAQLPDRGGKPSAGMKPTLD
jgi:hypothetical protein